MQNYKMAIWHTYVGVYLLLIGTYRKSLAVQVETKYGIVEGETVVLEDPFQGFSLDTFYGIPYAKPPLGEDRFQPPEEPDPWEDIKETKNLPSACIQHLNNSMMERTHPGWRDYSEDCLTLGIVAPSETAEGPYPVMVWLYGGAYTMGASFQYPGHFLAAYGVVVVLVNYRLDIFGFAYSGEEDAPGNMGMLDQVLALRFVQENIAQFGGDPDQVTIFGESAGAYSVGFLVVSPLAAGLFHGAIYQSGAELGPDAFYGPSHDTLGYMHEVAGHLNCSTENPEMIECMKGKSAWELKEHSYSYTCAPGLYCLGFRPIVGDVGGFLPATPFQMREQGDFNKVPILAGNEEEDSSYFEYQNDWAQGDGPNRTEFQRAVRGIVDKNAAYFPDEDRADTVYEAMDFFFTPWPHIEDGEKNRHQLFMMHTDARFGLSIDMVARSQSEYVPTYYYIHGYRPSGMDFPDWMGTFHMCDLPFMFGLPFLETNPAVADQTQIQTPIEHFDEKDEQYSLLMMEMWTNFGKYGNPTPEPITLPPTLGGDSFTWEAFTPDDYLYCYLGNNTVDMKENYRSQEYAFLEDYYQWMVWGDEGHVPGGGERPT